MEATMIRRARRARFSMLGGAAVLAMALAAASPAAAQEEARDCHCVDRDGNTVEGCVCMRMPSMDRVFTVAAFPRRAVVGVTVDYEQGPEVDARGAGIAEVMDDGPAAEAGLRSGDIVVRVGGTSVFDPLEASAERRLSESQSIPVQRFVRLVGALEPGEPVEMEVLRDGEPLTLTVTPDEPGTAAVTLPEFRFFGEDLPEGAWRLDADELRSGMEGLRDRLREGEWEMAGPGVFRFEGPGRQGEVRILGGEPAEGEPFRLRFRDDPCMDLTSGGEGVRVFGLGGGNCVDGAEFIELNPELGEYFGTEEGVLVARVAEGSTLGLRAGDVVLAVDGREVRSPAHVRRILQSYEPDEEFRLRILRRGSETEVLARGR